MIVTNGLERESGELSCSPLGYERICDEMAAAAREMIAQLDRAEKLWGLHPVVRRLRDSLKATVIAYDKETQK